MQRAFKKAEDPLNFGTLPAGQGKPADRFDAEQWDRVYLTRTGGSFVFRRGVELTGDIISGISSPGELWLDIGCGTGHLAAALSRSGLSAIGIDHDLEMIDYAKRRFLNADSTESLKFAAADAYHLPFDDGTVDGIAATSLVGCLSDANAFFQEVYRVLRRGGYCVITFSNRDSCLHRINAAIRKLTSHTETLNGSNFSFRLYRYGHVEKDLQRIGFTVVEVRYYNFILNWKDRLLPSENTAIRLERLNDSNIWRRLGRNFIVLAQKVD